MKLLSDSESDGENHAEIRINKKYAQSFEKKEKAKDLQKAQELDLYSDSESDESEDSDAELLSDKLDLEIMETIKKIRNHDPSIYDKNVSLYSAESLNASDSKKDSDHKKKTYKDVIREQLLQDGAGSDLDEMEDEDQRRSKKDNLKNKNFLYDKEQEDLRSAFLKNIKDEEGESDSEDGSDNELFTEKKKTKEEAAEEEKKLKAAISALQTDTKDEKESFLLNYFSQKQWKEPQFKFSTSKHSESEMDDEADEEAVEAMENFESKYNFRFEEVTEGGGTVSQVQGHARNVEGSLRRVEDKRKKQREERKEKKEREKRQKEEEIKRLKNLKRQELNERLKKIGSISGLKKLGILNEDFLDDDWDEEKHEQYMKEEFNDDYYNEEDAEFAVGEEDGPLNDDELKELIGDDYEDYSKEYQDEYNAAMEEEEDDENIEVNDEDKEAIQKSLNELYSLDYEDIIAGMPCRFKYAKVQPDDFGLTTEEIIAADDKQLNKYLSLKYLSPYRAIDQEKIQSKLKKRQKGFKYSIKESLQKLKEEEERLLNNSAPSYVNSGKSKKEEDLLNSDKKKRRKRKKSEEDLVPQTKPIQFEEETPLKKLKSEAANEEKNKKRNRKHKKKD